MKRLAVVLFVAFLFWSVVPAYGNTVPQIAISCTDVSFAWTGFPTHPVVLTVTVTQGDGVTVASFNTDGKTAGDGSVPVQLGNGTASATVSWTLQRGHHAGAVTADLECSTTTTEPPTTEPPTTLTSTTSTVPPPNTTPPEQCGPDTLACTGSSSTWLLVIGAGMLIAMGAAALIGSRVHRSER